MQDHEHNWKYDAGDPSVGIWPGWWCEFYDEAAGESCLEQPDDEEIDRLEERRE